jgi:hypothetical protein
MATDTTRPQTRRNLLTAAIGGMAAMAAGALSRGAPARAGSDTIVHVGGTYDDATSLTTIHNMAQ